MHDEIRTTMVVDQSEIGVPQVLQNGLRLGGSVEEGDGMSFPKSRGTDRDHQEGGSVIPNRSTIETVSQSISLCA
jgi:hypothetical protein